MLTELYPQFLTIAILHLFAVMSPGPDFALIVRQSLCYNRKISIITSLGIGFGILFHIFLSITGVGIIISNSIILFDIIKISGGLYLMFLGYNSIASNVKIVLKVDQKSKNIKNNINAFLNGLITNILNPKATLFFLSLYTFIINNQPIVQIQIFYGIWMAIITTLWFCLLSIILTHSIIRKKIQKFLNIIQNITGIMLIAIGIQLIFFN
ncbi:MAG: hypothetical protein CMG25_00605 [Candidatus Marinimicrobia bacterium]|nr:hypothetical protein [Candidatus Neomarinimicrobiota bacterium]